MSFKEKLTQLVIDHELSGDTLDREHHIEQIINLVDKELPDKMHSESPEMLLRGWFDYEYKAYNQAIDDMRAKLKGVSNG